MQPVGHAYNLILKGISHIYNVIPWIKCLIKEMLRIKWLIRMISYKKIAWRSGERKTISECL